MPEPVAYGLVDFARDLRHVLEFGGVDGRVEEETSGALVVRVWRMDPPSLFARFSLGQALNRPEQAQVLAAAIVRVVATQGVDTAEP